MMKHVLTGAVALVLMAGASYAQDSESVVRDKTVVQRPDGDRTVDTHTTVRKDDDGDRSVVNRNVVRRTDGDGDISVTKRTTDVNRDDGDVSRSTTVQHTTVDR
jgi:hypothetical protein